MTETLRLGRLEVAIDLAIGVTVAGATSARVRLVGRIDDTVRLGALVDRLPPGDVVLDTAGVAFVNSVGMRAWVRLVRALGARGTVTLEAVSDVLITQMNLLAAFRGAAIASFHAAYVCAACGCEATPLVDAIAHRAALRAMQAPALPCPECGAAMELADYPERYLSVFRP